MMKLPPMAAVRKGTMTVDVFNEKWTLLASAIDQIHGCKQAGCSFQILYQACFHLVQQGYEDKLFEHIVQKLTQLAVDEQRIVADAASSSAGAQSSSFLASLAEQWQRHSVTTSHVKDLVMALEKRRAEKGQRVLVTTMSTRLFGKHVVRDEGISKAMVDGFLDAVRRDRDGEEAPSEMRLRSVAMMLLNIDDAEGQGSTALFRPVLEIPYLQAATAYYNAEAANALATMSVPQYVAHYGRRVADENRRTAACLDPSTVSRADAIVSMAYIEAHRDALIQNEASGVHAQLRSWRIDDLRNLYAAFAHVRDLEPLTVATTAFFEQEGLSIVKDETNISTPRVFVEKLIELHERMNELLRSAYTTTDRVDRFVEAALRKVFAKVVNHQSFTAEYLSRMLDAKLRAQPTDADVERLSDEVMALFQYLTDKDLFEAAYKGHLARRLLLGRTTSSEEQERIFIARLKKECGVSAASSLEGMFGDRAKSDELMDRFRERLAERQETLPASMHCFVLTAGIWPPPQPATMAMPHEMEVSAKVFQMFYLGRHHGRRFEYSFANGSVDLRLHHGGRKYDVNVPTLCTAVLMQFQGTEVRTVEEIARAAEMSTPDTAKAVASLARSTPSNSGVLALETTAGPLTSTSRVMFNPKFKSKTLKLRVAMAVAKERDATGGLSSDRAREQLDEDRKYKVDAAVVRIMKSRKTLDHHTLVAEVVTVLKKMFLPAPDMIKRRIENLIEREFLERSPDERNVYNYLA